MRKEKLYGIFPAGVILTLGALARLLIIYANRYYLGGDEAIVGLMGKHILEGAGFPLFYYGQSYMGSLEAMLAALLFALGGISVVTLRLAPFIFSLLFLAVLYCSARRFSATGFPLIPLTLAAVAPVFFVQWSVWARGGFIGVLFFGQLSLLLLSHLLENPVSPRYYLLTGFILGLGFWTNPLIIPYLAAVGGTLFVTAIRQVERRGRLLTCFSLSFLLGATPLIIYNLYNRGATAIYLVKSFAGISQSTWETHGFWYSLVSFLTRRLLIYPATATRSLSALFIVAPNSPLNRLNWALSGGLLVLFLYHTLKGHWTLTRNWQLQTLRCYGLLLFLTFFLGSSGRYIPRYFLPIYSVYPIAFGLVLSRFLEKSRGLFAVVIGLILLLNSIGIAGAVRNPFSSNLQPLINALDELGIRFGYANYDTSYQTVFHTRERIILSPTIPTSLGFADRYPAYTGKVDRASRQAYVFFSGGAEEAIFIREIQKRGLQYNLRQADGYSIFYNLSDPYLSPDLKKLFLDYAEPQS